MLPYRDNCVKILMLNLLKIYNAYIHMIFKNKFDYTVHVVFHQQYISLRMFNEKMIFYYVYFTISLLLNIYIQ